MPTVQPTIKTPNSREFHDTAEILTGIIVGLGLAATLLTLFAIPLANNMSITRDFIEYWASGQQLVHHASPYDFDAIAAWEQSAGCPKGPALPMLSPPWILPLLYPLGFLGARIAAVLWNLFLFGCLLLSVHLIRQMHGSPPNRLHWLSIAFTPVILVLAMGQISILALLGVTLFLRYHEQRPILSGAALWLCVLKPHLLLIFLVVLALWILTTRRYQIAIGAVAAMALSTATALLIEPHAWSEYLHVAQFSQAVMQFAPCFAGVIRHWIAPQARWLQYLPAAVSSVWAIIYYWRHRASWSWLRHGNLLILVSLLVAPYGFVYDQCCALPAILHGVYVTRSRKALAALALLILLADIQLFGVSSYSPLSSPHWIWTGLAWIVWYSIVLAV
jgi:hypothetical protein